MVKIFWLSKLRIHCSHFNWRQLFEAVCWFNSSFNLKDQKTTKMACRRGEASAAAQLAPCDPRRLFGNDGELQHSPTKCQSPTTGRVINIHNTSADCTPLLLTLQGHPRESVCLLSQQPKEIKSSLRTSGGCRETGREKPEQEPESLPDCLPLPVETLSSVQ